MTGRPDPRRAVGSTPSTRQAIVLLVAVLALTALVALAVFGWLEHAA